MMNPSNSTRERRRRLPRFALAFYATALLCGILYVAFLLSEPFSDWFNRHVSALLRGALAHLTNWIPFSLGEFLILMLIPLLILLIGYGLKHFADSWRDVGIFCASLLSVAALVFSLFTVGFAPAYRGTSLDRKLGISRREVSAEELYHTAEILTAHVKEEMEQIHFSTSSRFSVMPYNYDEMSDKLLDAYDAACDRYDFMQRLSSRVKPVMLSEAMSYTHITGVYTFFTGEANINVAFPDYTVPYTAAHELSHQRGIAREDEANFMAFLVCLESEDPYIRYSGYLNLLEYVLSALSSASSQLYRQAYAALPGEVLGEMAAFSQFFEQYRHSVASEVSETVNNTFLVMHGTEGTKSYGMVVDLAVAYYRSH